MQGESVVEQLVRLGMVPVADLVNITEERPQECVQNEAEIIPERYDFHQNERDIRDDKMSSNKIESFKNRLHLLSLPYGRRLRNMRYGNLFLNGGSLAIRHIYRRLFYSQIKNLIHGFMELHREDGFKYDYKKIMRKILEEAEETCGIPIRVLRLLRILTDLNELRINVGHVWALEHCARTVILASTDYTFTAPD